MNSEIWVFYFDIWRREAVLSQRFLISMIRIRQMLQENAKTACSRVVVNFWQLSHCFWRICSKLLQVLTNVIIKIKLNHANFSENLDRITENTKKYGSLLKMKNHVNINVGRLITLNSGTSNSRKIPGPKNATWDVAL